MEHDIYEETEPEFLVQLPPKVLAKQKDNVSLDYVIKGILPSYVVWLHNNVVEESRSYSLKHDGPLCCLNVMNTGPRQGGIYTCKIINAAGDTVCSTQLRAKTGLHLHALVLPM